LDSHPTEINAYQYALTTIIFIWDFDCCLAVHLLALGNLNFRSIIGFPWIALRIASLPLSFEVREMLGIRGSGDK
jgi:hypothetical protein